MEFAEEEASDFVHRDKMKEMNVLEWIGLVVQEPLQVSLIRSLYLRKPNPRGSELKYKYTSKDAR